MFFESILMACVMAIIMTLTLRHLPLFVKRVFYYTPAWLTAAVLHFGYGAWLGGVTGHLLGAMLSIPMYFILRYYLQPEFGREIAVAWDQNWFNVRILTPCRTRFHAMLVWSGFFRYEEDPVAA